ncbi:MAG: hypothetical protein Q9195_008173 [Heterodermia aff. obscurata]
MLSSLGAFEGEKWPPYTSHVAVELFRKDEEVVRQTDIKQEQRPRMLSFGGAKRNESTQGSPARKKLDELSESERDRLRGFYVRLRYNDRPMMIPGCRLPGKHLEGNEGRVQVALFNASKVSHGPSLLSILIASASQHAVPSPDGSVVAAVLQSQLVLRSTVDDQILASYSLPSVNQNTYRHLKLSRRPSLAGVDSPLRILVANDDTIHVFEVRSPQWKAVINNAVGNMGKIVHVDFGANEDEVVVFSDFGFKATIWSLVTSRGVEVRDPKNSSRCHDYRPKTKHWAILTRELARDNLLILAPGTHEVLENVELPTVDAQGVKWSSDGPWLVIWDSASSGYKVLIYTADGHLFKTYAGGQTVDEIGLGVKNVAWGPQGKHLAIGDYNDRVTVLADISFLPISSYMHPSSIEPHQMDVWEEQIHHSQSRTYVRVTGPSTLPPQSSLLGRNESITGISLMEFNTDGTLLASRSDSTPSTLWIWSMTSRTPIAVLIHHAAIRSVRWHPTIAGTLLIHCALENPVVHLWNSTWEMPVILEMRLDTTGGRMEASWLLSETHEQCALMMGNASNYTTARISADGELLPFSNGEQPLDQGPDERFDGSLIDLSPIKLPQNDASFEEYEHSNAHTGDLDDTFRHKRLAQTTA